VRSRRADLSLAGLLAAVCYVPLLLSKPGQVAADTKQYLYLDPTKLTVGAASMWDPNTGMGTVTHQNIGYLFPMGPYFSLVQWLGIPVWVGQRIWMGSLMLAAGLGVAYCARQLGLEGTGRGVAAFAYALSPYTIDYLDRTSAILMPWSALGWMIGFTALAARTGRWRYPAGFAFVVALVGGVNATSILLVMLGPALWLVHAVWVSREVRFRAALSAGLRIGVLSLFVSLWWAAGLWAEGRYGINVLRVTETIPTVARTSAASEVLRGLGYWYFYGWDKVQPWTLPAVEYTQTLWLLGLSLILPGVCLIMGMLSRWRYRSFCLGLVGLGTAIAVGAFPYSTPSLWGSVIKNASTGSSIALAMRSVDRIVPLVIMGLALLMGSGVTGLHLWRPRVGMAAMVACLGLVAVDLPPLWTGDMIASNLDRPSQLPAYWTAAASYLNSQGSSSRVLGLPGEDFGAYSFGVTEDPIPPGLLDRPYVSRQVVPSGTPASANLLQALDEPIQEGTLDPAVIAPIARLMSVGQILLQSDLQYERYHLPLPQVLWRELVPAPSGISQPKSFGAPDVAKTIRYPLNSELRLGLPAADPEPPALAVFNVADPRPLVRAESAQSPVLLAGDGNGVVEAAGAGLLDDNPTILYGATLTHDHAAFSQAMDSGATLVVTDTNALAVDTWGSLRDNTGQVQQPGAPALASDPSLYALPVFPNETTDDQTVAEVSGIASVQATNYGDSLSSTPEDRPVNAVDGDLSTAWTFGAHERVQDDTIRINLTTPVTTDHIKLVQAQLLGGLTRRHVTSVTLRFDGAAPLTVSLTKASLTTTGQIVTFPRRAFTSLELTADNATGGVDKNYDGLAQVGFSEIAIPGVAPVAESLRLPTDLLDMAGAKSLLHPLDILMQRIRAIEPPRHDPEPTMSRTVDLPTARTFSLSGTAEVNSGDSDYLIDQMIGLTPDGPLPKPEPASTPGPAVVLAANSSTRLDDDRQSRANDAVDGDPSTAWVAETGRQSGEWIDFDLSKPVTFDHLDLQVINDGRHSLPSQLTISTPSGSRTVDVPVPAVGQGRPQGSTSEVELHFAPLSGSFVKVTVDAVHQVRTLDYYSTFAGITDILPVGIAELGIPDVAQPGAPAQIPARCLSDLLKIDGRPVDVEVTGSVSGALAGDQLSIRGCGNSANGVTLGPGSHVVQTSVRLPSGWSIDQLWLGSAAGGSASVPLSAPSTSTTVSTPPAPSVHVLAQNRTSTSVEVDGTGQGFWLVLGQSFSSGWSATLADGKSLGPPTLIDAFANGWYVPAGEIDGPTVVHIEWTPQEVVWTAIGISGVAIGLCLVVAVWPEGSDPLGSVRRRLRRRARPTVPPGVANPPLGFGPQAVSPAALAGWGGARPRLWVALAAAVMWAVVADVFTLPAIAGAAAVAVLSGAWWRPGRLVVRIAGLGFLIALPVYEVDQQHAHRYLPTIDWPGAMSAANNLAWLALALLGADLVAGLVRHRWGQASSL
jgi:hypothetical protein